MHLFLISLFAGFLAFSQNVHPVDFLNADMAIMIDTEKRTLNGEGTYNFQVLSNTDSVHFDAINMDFSAVLLNGKKVRYRNTGRSLVLKRRLKAGRKYSVSLAYSVKPDQTVYFVGWDDDNPDNNQVWTQGQGKGTSRWLPSFDDLSEKLVFNLAISFDPAYEVIANGKLEGTEIAGGLKTWHYRMKQPMSSYLLAFAIGKYRVNSFKSASGIPQHHYFYPADSLCYEPTFRYSGEIFDFMETEIGVPYPWQDYKQVPVSDFLYAGMENTGTTLFSDGFVIDSIAFTDRNYVNINAHELAHQWFGDLVTERSSADHWLHEGFATYYAYLAEKRLFGDDYFYWKLFDTANTLDTFAREGGGEALTDPKAGSLTFYEKGAWALFMLKETLGEEAFRKGMRNYLGKFAYKNATVSQFLVQLEQAGGRELQSFRAEWLDNKGFPIKAALEKLAERCESLRQFMAMQQELTVSNTPNAQILNRYWENVSSTHFKAALVRTYFGSLPDSLLKKAFRSDDVRIRQAVILRTSAISTDLKEEYESLLHDPSYVTREAALYKLWIYFDKDRARYLDETKGVWGLPNMNIRLLWLTLALLTPGYDAAHSRDYYSELSAYTAAGYNTETRQMAFEYLKEAFPFTDESLKDLIKATVHPSWQFRNYARKLFDTLYEDDKYRSRLNTLASQLTEADLRYIRQKTNTK